MALEVIMQSLLDCAKAAYNDDTRPQLVFLNPGSTVAWDQCDCGGMMWVRAAPVTPADSVQGNCGPVVLQASLFLGVIRCVHGLTDQGFPTGDEMTADALKMIDDMEILLDAIRCCFKKDRAGVSIRSWQPLGNEGTCGGGEWQADVVYPAGCGCDE